MRKCAPNYMDCALNRREFVKAAAAASVSFPFGLRVVSAAASAASDKSVIGSSAQLFIDDEIIEEQKGLHRALHRPRKAGLIQEADGRSWEVGDQISVVRDLS